MHNKNFIKDNLQNHPIAQRLMAPGPKRILSLDGGGIRGAISIGYLSEIECILRERFNEPNLVLADYFDLIGGTSTGAIIATLLAKGHTVSEVEQKYKELGGKIFGSRFWGIAYFFLPYFLPAKYDAKPLETEIERAVKNITLGDGKDLKTGLCIFAKRADTLTPYAFYNHPRGYYYDENKGLLLKDLLRATSAAPTYFTAKELTMGDNEKAIFIDGGVSNVNNPSLMLFLLAVLKRYAFQWKKGKDNLLLISIGTGTHRPKLQANRFRQLLNKMSLLWAKDIPDLFMLDATRFNQLMLSSISDSNSSEELSNEEKNFDTLLTEEPLVTYKRYNVFLERNTMHQLNLVYTEKELESLRKMDNGKNVKTLLDIGHRAKVKITPADLPPAFDFGIIKSSIRVISQQDAKSIFLPLLKTHGKEYEKYGIVLADQADENTTVISITRYGIETTNHATKGDYIITNQNTEAKEKYIVKESKFLPRYKKVSADPNDKKYIPIGKIIAIQLTKQILNQIEYPLHFKLIADWKEEQYTGVDDFIVCPLDESEVYRIGYDEFSDTYKMTNM